VTHPPFDQGNPHSDGAGVIEAVGAGVGPARVGQRRLEFWNATMAAAFRTARDHISALPQGAGGNRLPDDLSFEKQRPALASPD